MAEKTSKNSKKGIASWTDLFVFVERKRPPNFLISVLITSIKMMVVIVTALSLGVAGLVLGMAKGYFDTTPELNVATIDEQNLTSFIYDMNGDLITAYKGSENRVWAGIDEIPEMLQNAFVALEDARFWTHNGVDLKRMAGALVSNLSNSTTQGGSTITQQLISMRVLTKEVSYKRKLQEAYLALELERQYTKQQILESYLNTIWLGESNYGVRAAAMDYFGKNLSELTLRECAMLAGITRNPTSYNPRRNYYQREDPEPSVTRTARALYAMLENNYITRAQYEDALVQDVHIVEESAVNQLYPMPYAVEKALDDVITAFLEKRDMANTDANRTAVRREIQSGGYSIYTTFDPEIQRIAEDTVYNWDDYPDMKEKADAITRQELSNGVIVIVEQPQAAVVIYDHEAGEIRAIVGGRSAPTQFLQFNRATTNTMPVGSSIKPLTVYGPALDMGYSPASVVENMEIAIPGWETDDGKGYSGSSNGSPVVTLRKGIVSSLNIATTHVLLDYVGMNNSKNYLSSYGIDTSASRILTDGFGLALGSSGITPYEMAVAFGTIANGGQYSEPLTFTKVTDANGNVLLDRKAEQEETKMQVLRKSTAYMLVDMLVNAVNSGTGTDARVSGVTVGGKTGTNSKNVGVTFSGITPDYSCSIWVGSDEYKQLKSTSYGGNTAAPLFKAIMERVYEEKQSEARPIMEENPDELGLIKLTTCSLSGMLATDACHADGTYKPVTDWHHAESAPVDECSMHRFFNVCDETGLYEGDFCPLITAQMAVVIQPGDILYKYSRETLSKWFPDAYYMTQTIDMATGDIIPWEIVHMTTGISPDKCYLHSFPQEQQDTPSDEPEDFWWGEPPVG